MLPSAGYRNAFTGDHDALTNRIIRVFRAVAQELGPGFPESIYLRALCAALQEAGLQFEQQCPIPVQFRGVTVGQFQADLVVEQAVLVQLKVGEEITRQSESQLRQYLSVCTMEDGLLLAFGHKPLFKCMLMTNNRKHHPLSVSTPLPPPDPS